MSNGQEFLTTGQVASHCGVHLRTVLRWIKQGRLPAYRLPGPRGDNRIRVPDFVAFLRANDLPLPEGLGMDSHRVLVVDDDQLMANGIRRVLAREGFEVEVAEDGLRAGMLLRSFAPAVMTLDLRMPGIDGYQVLDFIREQPNLSGLRVLVISAMPPDDLARALEHGADAVLAKPFDPHELVEKISALGGAAIERRTAT